MHTILAADAPALEKFMIATPTSALWSGLAISGAMVLVIIASVALLAYLLLLMRPPSRARVVCGFVAAIGFNLFMPSLLAFIVLSRVPIGLRVLLGIVPLVALAFVLHGIVWIARHWRAFDPTRCGNCGHRLLREQSECPECGASRRPSPVWGWGVEQARVAARTGLAAGCVAISLYAIGLLGALKIEWHATLFVDLLDEDGSYLASVIADAKVVERSVATEIDGSYGANGVIRAVRGAVAAPPSIAGRWVAYAPLEPGDGGVVDDAWLNAPSAQLASFPPSAAEAATSWLRTTTARLDGRPADFAGGIRRVETSIDLRHPSIGALAAVVCAGPIGAGLLALAWNWFAARILRRAQAAGETAPTQTSG